MMDAVTGAVLVALQNAEAPVGRTAGYPVTSVVMRQVTNAL
jgi:hypothetical protein